MRFATVPVPRRVQPALTRHEAAALLLAATLVADDPDMRGPHSYLTPAQGVALDRAVRKIRTATQES